jgi:hypothetical protein
LGYVNAMLAEFIMIAMDTVYNSLISINAITGAVETYN